MSGAALSLHSPLSIFHYPLSYSCVGVSLLFPAPATIRMSSTASSSTWDRRSSPLAQGRAQRRLRLSRVARRLFLRRLSALRRHGALLADHARRGRISPDSGGLVLGHLQRLSDSLRSRGLLPGALVRNAGLQFVCQPVHLRVEETDTPFTGGIEKGPAAEDSRQAWRRAATSPMPPTLERLHKNRQILLRYVDAKGKADAGGQSQRLVGKYRRDLQRSGATSSA